MTGEIQKTGIRNNILHSGALMICPACAHRHVIGSSKKKNFSHYCLFSHAFMERAKEQCEAYKQVKEMKEKKEDTRI
jgi:hypothetical protein